MCERLMVGECAEQVGVSVPGEAEAVWKRVTLLGVGVTEEGRVGLRLLVGGENVVVGIVAERTNVTVQLGLRVSEVCDTEGGDLVMLGVAVPLNDDPVKLCDPVKLAVGVDKVADVLGDHALVGEVDGVTDREARDLVGVQVLLKDLRELGVGDSVVVGVYVGVKLL